MFHVKQLRIEALAGRAFGPEPVSLESAGCAMLPTLNP